ncbi:GNAT family N-acetyltransferase [Halobacteriales archaeon QS_4_62_28]|nr:MAG: GNAT family N-acetyltransferase [Halobacteriales archaeon QS_4_62_28]
MAVIRPASDGDVAGIQRVARTTWHATYDDILGSQTVDAQVNEWYADDVITGSIDDDRTVYLVATVDERVTGYASAGPTDDADAATLHAIYVLPDHWDDGIGSRLFEAVLKRLQERGFDQLRIYVLAENDRGRQFYERHGFSVTERDRVTLAGQHADEVIYEDAI